MFDIMTLIPDAVKFNPEYYQHYIYFSQKIVWIDFERWWT
jgi:hypothetical protein